ELGELARRARRIDFESIPSAEWRPERARAITIFDRFVPPLAPAGNVLYLAPGSGNGDVAVSGRVRGVRLAEVRDHDLVRGLRAVDAVLPDEITMIASGGGLRPVSSGATR